jgi:catechol 2,3-dioxygenase-like lactoylglutathione lyase family enzyme
MEDGMSIAEGLGIRFVAGFGPIVRTPEASRAFYMDVLGLPLKPMENDPNYFHGEEIEGVRHFALWPLSNAAESCFGSPEWPSSMPAPNAWLELDVDDVAAASKILKARGCRLLVDNRKEPWGQTVTRLLSPEGLLIGITFTPWLRS